MQIKTAQYDKFTPAERVNLTISALSRNDKMEMNSLIQSCPKFNYKITDPEFSDRMSSFERICQAYIIGVLLFYNQIITHRSKIVLLSLVSNAKEAWFLAEKGDGDISDSEWKVQLAEEECVQKQIENYELALNQNIVHLKGLHEALRRFCAQEKIDKEQFLSYIDMQKVCPDLDALLASEVSVDEEYVWDEKNKFCGIWNI